MSGPFRRTTYYERVRSTFMEPPKFHEKLFEDEVVSFDKWRFHRTSWRHRPRPITCLGVAAGVTWPLAYVGVLSFLVGGYAQLAKVHDWIQVDAVNWNQPFMMITFALALLLVFKTNSSYARWWEGRIAWGRIVNYARNLSRQGVLEPSEIQWLLDCNAKPSMVAQVLTNLLAKANIPWHARREMDRQIEIYENMVGAGERLLNTGIPSAYTRHTSRFLMLYVTLAPLLMWPGCGWATPVLSMFITFLLVGTENIGIQIEEPFHLLPLDTYCRGIQRTVREMQSRIDSTAELLGQPGAPRVVSVMGFGNPLFAGRSTHDSVVEGAEEHSSQGDDSPTASGHDRPTGHAPRPANGGPHDPQQQFDGAGATYRSVRRSSDTPPPSAALATEPHEQVRDAGDGAAAARSAHTHTPGAAAAAAEATLHEHPLGSGGVAGGSARTVRPTGAMAAMLRARQQRHSNPGTSSELVAIPAALPFPPMPGTRLPAPLPAAAAAAPPPAVPLPPPPPRHDSTAEEPAGRTPAALLPTIASGNALYVSDDGNGLGGSQGGEKGLPIASPGLAEVVVSGGSRGGEVGPGAGPRGSVAQASGERQQSLDFFTGLASIVPKAPQHPLDML